MPYFTSDGTNIHVEISGDGAPLLLLHELALDHRQWRAQKEALRSVRKIFCMDFRGHGRSARSGSGHTWTDWAADVQRGLVQCGMDRLNPAAVIAHGYACDVALQVALAEPRRITALLLVTPVVWGAPLAPQWRDLLHCMRQAAAADDLEGALAMLRQDASYAGVRSDADLERSVREMHQSFSGEYLLSQEQDEGKPTFERLRECATPTLVLSAALDRGDLGQTAEAVAAELPMARHQECEAVGHFPNLEAPDVFNRIVLDWLAESARSSQAAASP